MKPLSKFKECYFIAFLIFLPAFLFGQKEFKITKTADEFTGDTLIQSTWVKLSNTDNANQHECRQSYIRLNSTKQVILLELMYSTLGKTASINQGDELFIKLQNGTIITLKNSEYQISEKGKASPIFAGSDATGFYLFFPITKEDLILLSQNKIDKCRLTTNDGYMETGISKEENRDNVLRAFLSFYESIK